MSIVYEADMGFFKKADAELLTPAKHSVYSNALCLFSGA